MPWRNSPPTATAGIESSRDRLPRAIAARLARAGLIAPAASSAHAVPERATGQTEPRADASRARLEATQP